MGLFSNEEDYMRKRLKIFKDAPPKRRSCKAVSVSLLLTLILIVPGSAYAFEIPTGNDNVALRWDNQIRYTLMYRVASQNDSLLGIPPGNAGIPVIVNNNSDDGNRNFDKGIVSNRIDFLTEADLVYRRNYGARVSAAFWYDQAYHDSFDNDSVATSNYTRSYGRQEVNRLTSYGEKYFAGPDGELLDAFLFAKIDFGNIPVYLKLGRHVYYWGQAMMDPYNAISYAQMPLDLAKMAGNPGAEIKELFRPTAMASAVAQVTPSIQLAGQFMLENEANKFPASGTYFAVADVSIDGGGNMLFDLPASYAPILGRDRIFITHGRDIEPERHRDFGLALQWKPSFFVDTTFGFYYRQFSDRLPQLILCLDDLSYHAAYKSGIQMEGISVATQQFGISWGAELSFRQNMPLASTPLMGYVFSWQLPDRGDILSATGDTMHGVLNMMGLLKKTSLWDAGVWLVEFDYCRWLKVTNDPYHTFKGRGDYNAYALGALDFLREAGLYGIPGINQYDQVTRDSGQIFAQFAPQWLQILPGLDVSVPITVVCGLWGVAPVQGENGAGNGNASIAFNFTYLNTYKLGISYANYFGKLEDGSLGAFGKGNYAVMRDRDFVSMNFKFSF
jgi:hypothetical protein